MKIIAILKKTFISLVIVFIIFLLWATISDYKPDAKIIIKQNITLPLQKDTMSALIWNIGYAGLGAEMDFFYDGGEKMQTSKAITQKNFSYILDFLEAQKNKDFILLQEVDILSKRSYEINQQNRIGETLESYFWYFTHNYKVNFVPLPFGDPLGKVSSGLLCGSQHEPAIVIRHQFEGNYPWPKSTFMLDRCYTSMAFPLFGGDTLFVVNTHNTAYDDGNLRAMQIKQLKKWMLEKYNNSNYIVIGGDWNQLPPDVPITEYGNKPKSKNYEPKKIPEDFLPLNWQIVYDKKTPTNRGLDKPLNSETYRTLIDFFIVSPNINPITIKTINLEFKHSDHNPVELIFSLDKQKK
jgi:endonuclease/exonuclease/phosphatase family metal-dependent hydrolase